MSEQNNSMNGMDPGTGNSLEELFGSALPPLDLGDQIPASAQTMQPQPVPVESQPAAAPEAQPQPIPQQVEQAQPQMQPPQAVPNRAGQPSMQQTPQTGPVPAPQAVQQTAGPVTQAAPAAPVQQPAAVPTPQPAAGQVIDLFGAVAEDGAEARLARLANATPVFEYGSIREDITDPAMTFEQLRVKMSADCPELEARSHVSWTVSCAGITERVSSADASIFETKAKIEKGRKFKDALKKLKEKDRDPVCTVKPTVTAQKKGVLRFPGYKGLFCSTEQAEQSDKAIAYIPAQDGRVYEMRRNGIGTFIAPSQHIAELEGVRSGFHMSLPRLPAALLAQIVAFFRRVCVDYGRDLEALVNVLWDRQGRQYVLHVPPQRIDKASVETDLSQQPDPERYLHVMDVHSHNTMAARFSRTDDADEQATRLYMVVGRLDRYYPDIRCRFACGGRHVEVPAEQVCERTDVPFAPEWLKAVQETGLKEAA
ncbi:Mov34/MPN/PAD-1 family protein [Intestinibacillus sp. NTUH-41-i26]|uniref:Mov34/MPN/PAD-1 family protein n=1 Tax=Intestinibacillus sp. NTUH-41-i26 TaxID=3079303 RepID=UPI002934ACF9|nr:Mov34/MPN/PAD-1 family protein [Intestinibacillus sp. NTUH-41-i26]WOC75643.1 Mov34/MPN/PAD-1 family protein [Intestinibacillus sp. NTUH-41-i26]